MARFPSLLPHLKQPVLIVNPVSGRGNGHGRVDYLEKVAHELGWMGELLETSPNQHAGDLAMYAVKAGYHHIIICGGDGSVMEALDAVAGTTCILGIVPLGTGNLLSINLGLPRNTKDAMRVALNGTPKAIDIGRANGYYYGVLTGIGWDAVVIRDAKRELKDRLGLLAYFLSALKNLEHPISTYRITVDGNPSITVRAKSVLVANMGLIPGKIEAIPKTRPDSGELTVAIVQAESMLSWLALSVSALAGRLVDDPRLQLLVAKHVIIESLEGPQLVEADGNDLPATTTLCVDVIPGGINVLLPPVRTPKPSHT